ncbi:hypothetical protein FVF58_46755 [Paraburkholderia panacisoli]|uniref:Uncharacterized protein n=1 Tax=Paraburkholderia panacisoli TaxID=2603818 RepID=A0A5B0G5N1_9BURK|nr:hypothetical protein [Paraburkholderia panacisoli]KAA0997955.1 hypothetical protein FVF58_46755 [Paraburkholderia panacisoli]
MHLTTRSSARTCVSWRGIATSTLDFNDIRSSKSAKAEQSAATRRAYFDRQTGKIDISILTRSKLDKTIIGPVILESSDTLATAYDCRSVFHKFRMRLAFIANGIRADTYKRSLSDANLTKLECFL